MKIDTQFFGEIEIDETHLLEFPHTLAGFEGHTRYCLVPEGKEVPVFYFLQCISDPAVAFTVGFAQQFGINFDDTLLTDAEAVELRVKRATDTIVLLQFTKNPHGESENSLAPQFIPQISTPLVINPITRKGMQKELKNICWSATVTVAGDTLPQTEAEANCQRFLAMMAAGLKTPQ